MFSSQQRFEDGALDQGTLMSTIPAAEGTGRQRLAYLPVALFGSVMGLTGLSVAWMLGSELFGVDVVIGQALAIVACATFLVLAVGYAIKATTAFDAVRAEFRHPVAGSLFGTIFVSLLLLPIVIAPVALSLARGIWCFGCLGMVVFAVSIVVRWTSRRQEMKHATPAWIIPVVGMLDIPLAMRALGFSSLHGVMILGLAIGLFFAIPLFTLIFSRLVFEEPIPDALQPTLFILAAPFSVGVSAYVATTGQTDLFAQALYVLGLFMLVVLIGRIRFLGQCCPFRVAWWAVSFPLSATAIAALRIDLALHSRTTGAIAAVLLGAATLLIAYLFVRTWLGVFRGDLKRLSS